MAEYYMAGKRYEDLTFSDDFMFGMVLTSHPEIAKSIAELATGRKIAKIQVPIAQMSLKMLQSGKVVRFDVYFEDEADVCYDLEMQTTDSSELPKRTRYYQALLDSRHLKKGDKYVTLPDSYIVFICLDDPFRKGLATYTFQNWCEEAGFPLGDGSYKIFLNASTEMYHDKDAELIRFLRYVKDGEVSDLLTQQIDEAVNEVLDDENGKLMYVTLQEKIENAKLHSYAEGEADGKVKLAAQISGMLAKSGVEDVKKLLAEILKEYKEDA